MTGIAYTEIGRPPHEFGAACVDAAAYGGLMVQSLRDFAARFPLRPCGIPHTALVSHAPFVSHGIWKVGCPCGDFPIYSPEWCYAACFNCGAVFTDVNPAPHYREIEAILLRRPWMAQRNWTDETVGELHDENLAHGDLI